ncbi:MAG: glycosyltransferase family 9 protein [Planctomycetes bacterium]|nr:glycosyltransferase family 9 protein [Planctomycetota bacterium]MCP4837898.1 glycosyltransferase family 9 protein [Planctomycetota bacterium]
MFRPDRWGRMLGWLRSLRSAPWDVAIDCQGLARTGLMMAACGAKVRAGDRSAREGAWIPCNTRARVPGGVHEVDRMLSIAEALGVEPVLNPTLYVPAGATEWWNRSTAQRPSGAFAVLATTSRWRSKAWPSERWVGLAERLIHHGCVEWIALPGSGGERRQVAMVADALRAKGIRAVDYSGQTDVGQMMAMIEDAAITVSNDSAALHMAMGLGERCLGLFGPTNPAIVGPWRRPDLAIRAELLPGEKPSFRDRDLGDSVMSRLTVEAVAARALSLFEQWSV